MSPRRKSGLSAEDLQALKHLPAVLKALENLQEQHAKVRALMGQPTHAAQAPAMPLVSRVGPEGMWWEWVDADGRKHSVPVARVDGGSGLSSGVATQLRAGPPATTEALSSPLARTELSPVAATLDTPERREYEAAKKSGKPIPAAPDPFANATPEQKARMEEQRAFLASQGRGRSTQAPRIILTDAEPEPVGEEDVVREETLDTISDGTNQFNPPPEVQ